MRSVTRDEQGSSLVEFALLLPVLMPILLGIVVFGVAFGNYLVLTNATNMSAQALSICRGQCTDPCATTYNAFKAGAPGLNTANLQFTIAVNSSPSGSGSPTTLYTLFNGAKGASVSCSGTLNPASGAPADIIAGDAASVTVTYPCNLKVYSFNPAPHCVLTAQTSEAIQ
jgi:Flp pilus assembly protein TadG